MYFMTYDLQEALDEDDGLPNQIPDGYEHLLRWPLKAFPLVSRGSLVDPNTKEKLKRLMQDAIDEDLYPNSDAYQLDALVQRQLRVVAEGFVEHWLTRVDTIESPILPTKPWRSLATFRTRTAGNWARLSLCSTAGTSARTTTRRRWPDCC